MRTLANAEFKRWQTLPIQPRPLREVTGATRLPERRAELSSEPLCAKPEGGEDCSRQAEVTPDAGNLPRKESPRFTFINDHD